MLEGRGHDVLGQAVQPVRQRAAARWPPRGEPLIAPPAEQEGPGGHRLVQREFAELRVVFDQAGPAAGPEAFVTGRVLDDSVERDVLADDDLSHSVLLLIGVVSYRRRDGVGGENRHWFWHPQSPAVVAGAGSGNWCAAFGGRPGSRRASARPIPASTAQAAKADW